MIPTVLVPVNVLLVDADFTGQGDAFGDCRCISRFGTLYYRWGIETATCCVGAQETGGRAGTDIAFSGLSVLLVYSCCNIVISEELEQNADRTLFITSSGNAVGESAGIALLLPKLIASKRMGIAYPFLSSG